MLYKCSRSHTFHNYNYDDVIVMKHGYFRSSLNMIRVELYRLTGYDTVTGNAWCLYI